MKTYSYGDSELKNILGGAHERFSRLLAEANERAKPFYEKTFGEALDIETAIDRIFTDVSKRGDEALTHYSSLFDAALFWPELRVPQSAIDEAWENTDPELQKALTEAADNIRSYQTTLLPEKYLSKGWDELDVRWTPLDRVGAYVPGGVGGSLPLCSTVLMNLIPAKVAGVHETVVVTPPRADGSIAPELLAACKVTGVDEVYRIGGVQAIAGLACGTDSITRVDKIVGPGNILSPLPSAYLTAASTSICLRGQAKSWSLPMKANPAFVAADLLAQAEHDTIAMAVLVSTKAEVIDACIQEVHKQLASLPDERRQVAEQSIERMGAAILCANDDEIVQLTNKYAPEHLEILTNNAVALAEQIRHAGAIFIGPWSPEPIGDYVAGPSHTLPIWRHRLHVERYWR